MTGACPPFLRHEALETSLSPVDSLYNIWRICNLSSVLTQCFPLFSFFFFFFFFFFKQDSYTCLYSPYSSRNFCKEYGTLCTGIYEALFWVQWKYHSHMAWTNVSWMMCLLGEDHFVQNSCVRYQEILYPPLSLLWGHR